MSGSTHTILISFFIAILSIVAITCPAQDYIQYHKTFNKVDEDILSENYALALERLDSIYNTFDFIYAQHCMKSLQICCIANDSTRANRWLEKCFKQGVPMWTVRTDEITAKSLSYSTSANATQHYDSLRFTYKSHINSKLAQTIDSIFQIDQKYTQKVNDGFILFRPIYGLKWIRCNKRTFMAIDSITREYGFPGERIIGLPTTYEDSALQIEYIKQYGIHLRQWQAYFMLLHYFSTARKVQDDFKEILFENLKAGNLSSFQFATICNYIYKYSKHSRPKYESYNYKTDSNRISIGLNTIETERENTKKVINGKTYSGIIMDCP